MFYVYFLFLNNKTIYKGITADLKRRIKEHRLGRVASTKNKRPLKLIYYEAYLLKSDAERRERFLKTTEGRRLFRQQLRDFFKKEIEGSSGHSRSSDRAGSNDPATGRPVG